jgi:mRNA interferase MazF
MGIFIKGNVVVVPFPFSDLSSSKKRPALVVAELSGDDLILCQIQSRYRADGYSIGLSRADFTSGSLRHDSFIRPNRLFTADSNIVSYCAGTISQTKINEVINKLIQIMRA